MTLTTATATDLRSATETEIVDLIRTDWRTMSASSRAYYDAMLDQNALGLSWVTDAYYADGRGEIAYRFLGDATSWRGETARAVKAEMKRRLKAEHGY